MNKWIIITALILISCLAACLLRKQSVPPSLTEVHQNISSLFTDVEHINAQEFMSLANDELVIFDIREKAEYAVSHLDNAILVSPDMSAAEFIEKFGGFLENKQGVFYCSVGHRSSEFVERINQYQEDLNLVNLEGGLFNWVNEQRSISGKGIHPYNDEWGKFVKDKDMLRYTP